MSEPTWEERLLAKGDAHSKTRSQRDALLAACEMVLERWTFSNDQQHTHTWHDWADCKPVLDAAIAKAK